MKYLLRLANCIFILSVAVFFLVFAAPSFGSTDSEVLATVEGGVITMTDYQHFIKGIDGAINSEVVDKALLEKLITNRIILHAAVSKGIEVTDIEVAKDIEAFKKQNVLSQKDLEAALSKEGMTFEEYKKGIANKIRAMKLFSQEVESKVFVTDKEIEAYYSDHMKDYLLSPEKVGIRSVLIKLKQDASISEITELKREAMLIATEIREGGNFEKVINRRKAIAGSAGTESGSGEFRRGALAPEVDKMAFSMKIGETSGPIWVRNGVYIIKIVKKTGAGFKPITDVHKEIYGKIHERKSENNFNEWVRTLWEKTSVKIY